jgi:hypothetical protein
MPHSPGALPSGATALVVVMLVGSRVRRILIIHAREQRVVVEVLVLMIQADGVSELLAHDALSPLERVVERRPEIGVVELHVAGEDVTVRVDRDSGEPQPLVVAVGLQMCTWPVMP